MGMRWLRQWSPISCSIAAIVVAIVVGLLLAKLAGAI
jgi:hypothetical protein